MENALAFTSTLIELKEALPNGKPKIHGILIHPGVTIHPREAIRVHKYFKEDMIKAAPTLGGCPLCEDHEVMLGCTFDWGKWNEEKNGVEFDATITEEVVQRIKSGRYHGISACMNWMREGGGLRWVDGVAPYNFVFYEGSLITDKMTPGDPQAYFDLMEAVELWRGKNGMDIINQEADGKMSTVKNAQPALKKVKPWTAEDQAGCERLVLFVYHTLTPNLPYAESIANLMQIIKNTQQEKNFSEADKEQIIRSAYRTTPKAALEIMCSIMQEKEMQLERFKTVENLIPNERTLRVLDQSERDFIKRIGQIVETAKLANRLVEFSDLTLENERGNFVVFAEQIQSAIPENWRSRSWHNQTLRFVEAIRRAVI
jgi:hypothetical protein